MARISLTGFFCIVAAAALAQPAAQGPNITVTSLTATDGFHPGITGHIAVQVKLGAGWHVNAHTPKDEFLIPTVLTLEAPEGATVTQTVYPEPVSITLVGTNEPLAVYGGQFVVGIEIVLADGVQPGALNIEGKLQYQACDNKQCYAPKTIPISIPLKVVPKTQALAPQNEDVFKGIRFGTAAPSGGIDRDTADWKNLIKGFDVKGETSGYLSVKEFMAFLDGAESGTAPASKNPLAGSAVWLVIASVLVGGLLLNLTPCVLPLIPINLGIIGAGAKAGSRSRGFMLGGAYGLGIALTYGILGLVVILGVSTTFGAINSSPWFNAGIAIIFVALALAMFDVYLIDFTRFQTKVGIKRKEGGSFVVAFLMGAISALLAGACVAPVIISTIVYAQDQYAKGVSVALLLPFLVGVGMALPWPFAGAGLSFLPKPGKWMQRVKYAFGVLILLFAVYYGHLAYSLSTTAQEMDKEGWKASLAEGLAESKLEKKPVIIDFWATWCKNCLTMNVTTFKDAAVISRLDKYVKVKYQAEDPGDPATKEAMDHFGVVGLPTYIVLAPKP